jgi:hypothetical protein
MLVILYGSLSLLFDGSHLFRMVVIVRERSVYVGNVDVVTVGDGSWFEAAVLDLCFNKLNRDPPAFEMWLVV